MLMESDEDLDCPICMAAFDDTDMLFNPCPCGFKVCLYCYHKLKDEGKPCPACRELYSDEFVSTSQPTMSKSQRKKLQAKNKARPVDGESSLYDDDESALANKHVGLPGKAIVQNAHVVYKQLSGSLSPDVSNALRDIRVVQKNLLYIVGLTPQNAREEVLRKKEYFGVYGRIVKVAINKKTSPNSLTPQYSAYITFKDAADAKKAVSYYNGNMLDGRMTRATFGTTKFCTTFLQRQISCANSTCLYLHELADPSDCYTTEELAIADRFSPEFITATIGGTPLPAHYTSHPTSSNQDPEGHGLSIPLRENRLTDQQRDLYRNSTTNTTHVVSNHDDIDYNDQDLDDDTLYNGNTNATAAQTPEDLPVASQPPTKLSFASAAAANVGNTDGTQNATVSDTANKPSLLSPPSVISAPSKTAWNKPLTSLISQPGSNQPPMPVASPTVIITDDSLNTSQSTTPTNINPPQVNSHLFPALGAKPSVSNTSGNVKESTSSSSSLTTTVQSAWSFKDIAVSNINTPSQPTTVVASQNNVMQPASLNATPSTTNSTIILPNTSTVIAPSHTPGANPVVRIEASESTIISLTPSNIVGGDASSTPLVKPLQSVSVTDPQLTTPPAQPDQSDNTTPTTTAPAASTSATLQPPPGLSHPQSSAQPPAKFGYAAAAAAASTNSSSSANATKLTTMTPMNPIAAVQPSSHWLLPGAPGHSAATQPTRLSSLTGTKLTPLSQSSTTSKPLAPTSAASTNSAKLTVITPMRTNPVTPAPPVTTLASNSSSSVPKTQTPLSTTTSPASINAAVVPNSLSNPTVANISPPPGLALPSANSNTSIDPNAAASATPQPNLTGVSVIAPPPQVAPGLPVIASTTPLSTSIAPPVSAPSPTSAVSATAQPPAPTVVNDLDSLLGSFATPSAVTQPYFGQTGSHSHMMTGYNGMQGGAGFMGQPPGLTIPSAGSTSGSIAPSPMNAMGTPMGSTVPGWTNVAVQQGYGANYPNMYGSQQAMYYSQNATTTTNPMTQYGQSQYMYQQPTYQQQFNQQSGCISTTPQGTSASTDGSKPTQAGQMPSAHFGQPQLQSQQLQQQTPGIANTSMYNSYQHSYYLQQQQQMYQQQLAKQQQFQAQQAHQQAQKVQLASDTNANVDNSQLDTLQQQQQQQQNVNANGPTTPTAATTTTPQMTQAFQQQQAYYNYLMYQQQQQRQYYQYMQQQQQFQQQMNQQQQALAGVNPTLQPSTPTHMQQAVWGAMGSTTTLQGQGNMSSGVPGMMPTGQLNHTNQVDMTAQYYQYYQQQPQSQQNQPSQQ